MRKYNYDSIYMIQMYINYAIVLITFIYNIINVAIIITKTGCYKLVQIFLIINNASYTKCRPKRKFKRYIFT